MPIIKFVLAAVVNIAVKMLFAELAPRVNNRLANVSVNHISLEIQTICACHVRISSIDRHYDFSV